MWDKSGKEKKMFSRLDGAAFSLAVDSYPLLVWAKFKKKKRTAALKCERRCKKREGGVSVRKRRGCKRQTAAHAGAAMEGEKLQTTE